MTERKMEALVNLELSTFLPPPAGEALVLGKECPFGPETARRMLELVAPGDFQCIKVESSKIDSILIRAHLLKRMDKDKLLQTIAEEAEAIMDCGCTISVKCNVSIAVQKTVTIS